MSRNRVYNQTRGTWMKASSAENGIRERALCWVQEGVSVRQMTIAEAVEARRGDDKVREALPYTEVFGIRYRADESNTALTREGWNITRASNAFSAAMASGKEKESRLREVAESWPEIFSGLPTKQAIQQ